MRIPFEPESIENARSRLAAALEELNDLAIPGACPPSEKRKHVFDFTDGLRMIISKDLILNEETRHISASIDVTTDQEQILAAGPDAFVERVRVRWMEIGGSGPLRLIGWTEKGIPHFVAELVN